MKVKNMKAVRVHKYGGGPKDLVYEEDIMQPSHPREGEVLVRVYATGVTLNEIVWIWEHPGISLPLILGHEFSGLVEEVGPKVSNQRKGDVVYGLTDPLSITRNGTEAEYVIAMESEIASKPQSIDHEYAAGVPMAGLQLGKHYLFMHIYHQRIQYSFTEQLAVWVALQYSLLDGLVHMSLERLLHTIPVF